MVLLLTHAGCLLMFVAVSFPHFLQVPGHLKEQLQTREWVVARITSILERVVDPNVRIVPTVMRFVFFLIAFFLGPRE